MKIECVLHRVGGSHIDLGDKTYHFKPDATGRHVAEVTDNKHIQTFLAIPEGYQIADDSDVPAPKKNSAASVKDIDEKENDKDSENTDDSDEDNDDAEANERLELVKQYQAAFGKAPHHRLSNDTIREKLAEKGGE